MAERASSPMTRQAAQQPQGIRTKNTQSFLPDPERIPANPKQPSNYFENIPPPPGAAAPGVTFKMVLKADTIFKMFWKEIENVFNIFSNCFENILQIFWKYVENIFKMIFVFNCKAYLV